MTNDPIPLLLSGEDSVPDLAPDGENGNPSTGNQQGKTRPAPGVPRIPTVPTAPTATKPTTTPATTQQPATNPAAPAQTDKVAPPAPNAQPATAQPAPVGSTGVTQAEPAPPAPAGAKPAETKPADGKAGDSKDEDGKDADTDKPAIDPAQLAQVAQQVAPSLVSPLLSAATSIPGAFIGGLGSLMSVFGPILQSFGQGTPANPTSNGLPPELQQVLSQIDPSKAGSGDPVDSYSAEVGDQKTEATDLDDIEKQLNELVTQSGQNTTVNRDKIKDIISSVQTQIQSLGPLANTITGQAQIATTIANGLVQAGAVLSKAQGQSGVTSTQIQQLASRFAKKGSGNKLTSGISGTPTSSSSTAGTPSSLSSVNNQSSKKEIAKAILSEALRRGMTPKQAVAVLSTALQESGLDAGARGAEGPWNGIFQQDSSYPGRNNAATNINEFFNRLQAKMNTSGASQDIWRNIFWLQQRPGESSADAALANGRQAYLTEIQSQNARAAALYRELMA